MKNTKIYIGLSNPKSPSNVGAIIRASSCFGADAIFYTGRRYELSARFHTDTHDASRVIPLIGVSSLLEKVSADTRIVCVELVEGAAPLPAYVHPDKAIYIFGPEDGTISQDIIDSADDVVYIPTSSCLNLAATVNVVLYDRIAKAAMPISHDDLIRRSRDNNNRVRVKNKQ